jgi:hypothetical protein
MSALRELLVSFGVEVDDKELKQFTTGTMGGALEAVKGFGAALAGAFALREIGGFIREQIELGSHLNDTAEKLGVASDELQRFQYVAKLSGVEADSAAHSLQFLNKAVGLAVTNNSEGVKLFSELGISVRDASGHVRGMSELLPDIADKFQGMGSQQERTAYAMKLFGREGAALVPVLSQGRGAVAALSKQFDDFGGGMSRDFVDQADRAGDAIDGLKLVVTGLKSELALAVIPTITDWVKKFSEVGGAMVKTVRHTEAMKTAVMFFGGLGAFKVGSMALSFAKVAAKAAGFSDSLGGVLKLLLKFALPAAYIFALYLAFDDLYTLVTGGDSLIGRLLDKFGMFEEKRELIEGLRGAWEGVSDALKGVGHGFDDLLHHIGVNKSAMQVLIDLCVDWIKVLATAAIKVSALGEMFGQLIDDIAAGKGFSSDKYAEIFSKQQARSDAMWNTQDEMRANAAAGKYGTAPGGMNREWLNQAIYGTPYAQTGNVAMIPTVGAPTPPHIEQNNNNNYNITVTPATGEAAPDELLAILQANDAKKAADAAAALKRGAR